MSQSSKTKKEELAEQKAQEEKQIKEINERIEKEIAIHSMPQKFKEEKIKTSQTKKIGMLIMGGGIVFMLVVIFVLFYFLFILPNREVGEPAPIAPPATEAPAPITPPVPEEPETEDPIEIPAPEEPEAEDPIEIPVPEEPEEGPVKPIAMLDSDGDGLTDKEEALIGTDPFEFDTDRDGYNDLEELLNLYDLLGPGRLIENPNIESYSGEGIYEVYYPGAWIKSFYADFFMVSSIDNHFIQITSQANTDRQNLEEWYNEFVSSEPISADRKISFNNWSGIKSETGREVHLMDQDNNYIFVISYTPAFVDEPVYQNIYEMMLRSFKFL